MTACCRRSCSSTLDRADGARRSAVNRYRVRLMDCGFRATIRFSMTHRIVLAAVVVGLFAGSGTASAADRLTDQEVQKLLESIEHNRSTFEAALDEKTKNTVLKGPRGEVNVNEFLDDYEDQVTRTRERFKSDYSASSEVLALLEYSTRIDQWATTQPAGFRGSKEWAALAMDLRRLAASYNTTMPMAATGVARRFNDAELVAAAAAVEKLCDPFRKALDASLAANTAVTAATRQATVQQVDTLKSNAQALNRALANKQKGVAEAEALVKQALAIVDSTAKNNLSPAAAAAWNPLRSELGKVAWAYEVNNRNLPVTPAT